jgi:ABC-type lipoprotein export system ATPase subunit
MNDELMSKATTLQYAIAEPTTGEMTGILQARGLTKSFQMGETDFKVLRDLDFDLKPGEFVAIEGRSGSGKSTLLHILAALDSVDSGAVSFEGNDYTNRMRKSGLGRLKPLVEDSGDGVLATIVRFIVFAVAVVGLIVVHSCFPALRASVRSALSIFFLALGAAVIGLMVIRFIHWLWITIRQLQREGPAARLRNLQFGFIFQFYHLLPELNVVENTMLAPSIEHSWLGFRFRKAELRKRAVDLLEKLGMGHRLKHRPSQLSGGERQRVAIARALMNSPKVLFADEPTGNLDAETGRQIMDVLERLHREQKQTIVMVTHDRTLAREADRVLVLRDGKLETAA